MSLTDINKLTSKLVYDLNLELEKKIFMSPEMVALFRNDGVELSHNNTIITTEILRGAKEALYLSSTAKLEFELSDTKKRLAVATKELDDKNIELAEMRCEYAKTLEALEVERRRVKESVATICEKDHEISRLLKLSEEWIEVKKQWDAPSLKPRHLDF